jgi:sialidase-1
MLHFRAVAFSNDGVSGWSKLKFDRALPEPICMGSIVRFTKTPGDERNCILFANPHNPDGRQRKNLTIKVSYDEGRTWPVAKELEPGISGYSDLAVGSQGTIFCFYEDGAVGNHFQTKQLTLARFTLEWILGSKQTNN